MNARITPWLLLIALALLTALGPIDLLAGAKDNPHLLEQREFWLDVAGATVAAFALGVKAIVGLVSVALGVPMLQSATSKPAPAAPPPIDRTQ